MTAPRPALAQLRAAAALGAALAAAAGALALPRPALARAPGVARPVAQPPRTPASADSTRPKHFRAVISGADSGRVVDLTPLDTNGRPMGAAVRRTLRLTPASGPAVDTLPVRVPGAAPLDSMFVIVDGRELGRGSAAALARIPPETIERMEVIKGPAAAGVYGDKGRHGVVRITTKKAPAP